MDVPDLDLSLFNATRLSIIVLERALILWSEFCGVFILNEREFDGDANVRTGALDISKSIRIIGMGLKTIFYLFSEKWRKTIKLKC